MAAHESRGRIWGRLLARIALAVMLSIICATVPLADWAPRWISRFQMPVAVFGAVAYGGKLLYDTLFYNHFWP